VANDASGVRGNPADRTGRDGMGHAAA
jgi:hypothetical protein